MPVIVLSAVCDEEEQVRAFEAGADDYLLKPFRPRELVARLQANLRRAEPRDEEPCVELGGLEIDLAARTVRRDGGEIPLTPIEFKLLALLLRNRGRLVTHQLMLQQVWGPGYVEDRLIRTDHRVGYRLADMRHEASVMTQVPRLRSVHSAGADAA